MAQQLDGDPNLRAWRACIKYAFHLIEDRHGPEGVREMARRLTNKYPRDYEQRCEIARMLEDQLRRGARVTVS